jgi:cation diffusion facilitator CzcD-associated flavoprotein CzcO
MNDSYSSASEILHYFRTVAKDYGLMKYMHLNSKVVDARWSEEDQQWHVKIQKTDEPNIIIEDKAHILINASGVLK